MEFSEVPEEPSSEVHDETPGFLLIICFFHCCFETGSYVVQTGLELFFILPLPLKSWDYLAHKSIFVGLPEVMVVQTMGVNTLTWAEKEGPNPRQWLHLRTDRAEDNGRRT